MRLRYERHASNASRGNPSPVDPVTTELRQLRHVVALADHGNFARAAEALRMSQPALSRSVQAVERTLGGPLFRRTPSGAEPTDLGRVFVLRAREIVQMSEALGREMTHDRLLRVGHVSVGGGPLPGHSMLARALTRFVGAYPLVSVRMRIRDWDELLRGLRNRELELFVAETSTFEHEGDVAIEPLKPHPVFLMSRAGHPLAGRAGLEVSDLFDHPLVAPSRIPPRVLEPFRAAQRQAPNPVAAGRSLPAVECNDLSVIRQIVLETDAILASTLTSVREELESGRMTVVGSAPWLSTQYGIVTLRNHRLTAASARFREFVLEAERDLGRDEEALIARWDPHARGGEGPSARGRRRLREPHARR